MLVLKAVVAQFDASEGSNTKLGNFVFEKDRQYNEVTRIRKNQRKTDNTMARRQRTKYIKGG